MCRWLPGDVWLPSVCFALQTRAFLGQPDFMQMLQDINRNPGGRRLQGRCCGLHRRAVNPSWWAGEAGHQQQPSRWRQYCRALWRSLAAEVQGTQGSTTGPLTALALVQTRCRSTWVMSGSSWRCRWASPQAATRSHPSVCMHIVALHWERGGARAWNGCQPSSGLSCSCTGRRRHSACAHHSASPHCCLAALPSAGWAGHDCERGPRNGRVPRSSWRATAGGGGSQWKRGCR